LRAFKVPANPSHSSRSRRGRTGDALPTLWLEREEAFRETTIKPVSDRPTSRLTRKNPYSGKKPIRSLSSSAAICTTNKETRSKQADKSTPAKRAHGRVFEARTLRASAGEVNRQPEAFAVALNVGAPSFIYLSLRTFMKTKTMRETFFKLLHSGGGVRTGGLLLEVK